MPNAWHAGPVAALTVLALWANAGVAADDAPATPFVMKNRAPFAALIGIPGRWPDATDRNAELSWNATSHAMSDGSGGFLVVADGETHSLTARFQLDAWRGWQIGVQLPWLRHSGGFMDSMIDTWHDLFNLNEGTRGRTGEDQLNYVLQQQQADIFRIDRSVSGIGDVEVGVSRDLGTLFGAPWRLALNLKLPTGDVEKLTGSGSADFALGFGWRAPGTPGAKLRWWLDAGAVVPGDVDIVGLKTESLVYYYDAALTWRLLRRFDAILQLAGHSSLYAGNDTVLGEPAAQLAVGGLWHMSPRFGLRFGFFEDILAESAPDFGLELALLVRR